MTDAIPVHRVFFALWPDEPLRGQLFQMAQQLDADGRTVPAAHLHLTLAFPGTVPAAVANRLADAMCAIEVPLIRLRLDTLGYFTRPRIAWVGPSEVPETLAELANALNRICSQAGAPAECGVFRPHVSLRRGVTHVRTAEVPALDWSTDRIVLVESGRDGHPGPYRIRSRHPDTAGE
jgi:2'-5' RNA ligase